MNMRIHRSLAVVCMDDDDDDDAAAAAGRKELPHYSRNRGAGAARLVITLASFLSFRGVPTMPAEDFAAAYMHEPPPSPPPSCLLFLSSSFFFLIGLVDNYSRSVKTFVLGHAKLSAGMILDNLLSGRLNFFMPRPPLALSAPLFSSSAHEFG